MFKVSYRKRVENIIITAVITLKQTHSINLNDDCIRAIYDDSVS